MWNNCLTFVFVKFLIISSLTIITFNFKGIVVTIHIIAICKNLESFGKRDSGATHIDAWLMSDIFVNKAGLNERFKKLFKILG